MQSPAVRDLLVQNPYFLLFSSDPPHNINSINHKCYILSFLSSILQFTFFRNIFWPLVNQGPFIKRFHNFHEPIDKSSRNNRNPNSLRSAFENFLKLLRNQEILLVRNNSKELRPKKISFSNLSHSKVVRPSFFVIKFCSKLKFFFNYHHLIGDLISCNQNADFTGKYLYLSEI